MFLGFPESGGGQIQRRNNAAAGSKMQDPQHLNSLHADNFFRFPKTLVSTIF